MFFITRTFMNLSTDGRRKRWVLLLSSPQAAQAVACANHCLQSYFFHKEFFGEFIVFQNLNMNFTILFNVILSDLSKLSLGFKTETLLWSQKYSHVDIDTYCFERKLRSSKVSQARPLHACWTRMLYHERLETIENSQSTNSAKTLNIFNVYSSLGL